MVSTNALSGRLTLAVAVCGFALGKSPNPMEGAVKIFKGLVGLQPSMAAVVFAFVFFVGLADHRQQTRVWLGLPIWRLAGTDLQPAHPQTRETQKGSFSDIEPGPRWALRVDAVTPIWSCRRQEGPRRLPLHESLQPVQPSFETPTILLTVILAVGLSLVTYRPFCQFICPFGFVSWLAERFSIFGVQVNHDRCGGCGACAVACPLPAAQDLVDGKIFAADCYSCARCLSVCPDEAIYYGLRRRYSHSSSAGDE